MKRLFMIILMLTLTMLLYAPAYYKAAISAGMGINPFEDLHRAARMVESHNDDSAYNPEEDAYGALQIRPIRLVDYNQATGSHYTLYDCYDSTIARKIYMYYASKYGPMDLETIAKAWNGSGQKTQDYWKRIKEEL